MAQKQQVRPNVEKLEDRSLMSASNLIRSDFMQPVVPRHADPGNARVVEPVRMQVNYHLPAEHARPTGKLATQTSLAADLMGREKAAAPAQAAPGQAAPGASSTQVYFGVYYRSCADSPWTCYGWYLKKRDARLASNWIHSYGYQTFVYRYAVRM